MGTGGSFPEGKRPEREAGHWPTSTEVKNEWHYTSTPVCLLGMYRDNFGLPLPLSLFPNVIYGLGTQTVGIQCLMSSHVNLCNVVHISVERRCVHPVVIVLLSPWNEWNGSEEAAVAVDELFANLNSSRLTRAAFFDNASYPRWLSALCDSEGQWWILRCTYSYLSTAVQLKLWKLLPFCVKNTEKTCKSSSRKWLFCVIYNL
jgi:hypothetical protein